MRSEIIQIVACTNYDGFPQLGFRFSWKNHFHYFKDYLMEKKTLG
jgi:hypothetical protein